MTLENKTIFGILWNFAEQLARRGISVVVTLLLAFFLAPEDFGVVAMMSVFLALGSSLMESGFKQALIRRKEVTQTDFNTAFYVNIVLGVFAYGFLFFIAPWVADFYNELELVVLIRVASLAIIVKSLQVVQLAILTRDLNFKIQLKINLPAAFISGVLAIILACLGLGVWALIFQMLASVVLASIFLWMQNIWRPSLSFSLISLKEMYNFGYKLFISSILDILFKNMYVIVIAKFFSAYVAGLYFFADKIKELVINQLVSSIQKVTYPALSTMQDDNARLKAGYRSVLSVTTFLLFPMMLFLAALSQLLFEVLLPEKWWPAASYLQLMLLAGTLYPLHSINLNILKVKGRSDLFLYLEIFKKSIVVVIFINSFQYGVTGILVGQILMSIFGYIPNSYFSYRLINYSIKEQVADFLPSLGLSFAVAGLIYYLCTILEWLPMMKLLLLSLLALILYIVGAHFLKLQAYILVQRLIMQTFKKEMPTS